MYTSKVQGGLGSACATDADCNNATCFTTNWIGWGVDTLGGFCSRTCAADSDCGGGVCLPGGDGSNYCVPPCDAPFHCRDDYLCVTFFGRANCEPASFWPELDCDPDSVTCTTGSGASGGCRRAALGSGDLGVCTLECYTSACASGDGCHYVDDTADKGRYKGLLCIPESSSPVDVGFPCFLNSDCVSGAECVSDSDGGYTCHALCALGSDCSDGRACSNFTSPGPVGYCL